MKLLRVKILGQNFRSLPANVDYVFNDTLTENKLSTKVFAGLNGSGKSNFLELIAEIFYYLERFSLEKTSKDYKKNKNIGFEIEYVIANKDIISHKKRFSLLDDTIDADIHVRIIKQLDELPEFSYSSYGDTKFVRLDNTIGQLLPTHIIAYTSGQNELLSNAFIRIRYHYFNETQNLSNSLFDRRMYFIDEESNYSIFVANMLLGKEKPLTYLKKIFGVEDLYSFRITVNYKTRNKGDEQLLKTKIGLLEPLKACASSWKNDIVNKVLVLDFVVNEATHQAFKHYYKSAFKLFQVFYELQSLNLLVDKQDVRKFVVNASKVLNVSDELSKPDPSDLIFRIEKIRIKKVPKKITEKDNNKPIYYKALSDGEHQLNEVIGSVMMMENEGSLFLMDEPDTHFNPKWRAKMVTMLNQVSGNEYDVKGNPEKIRQHEIIMTTHSPFIISDNQKEDVYKFEREIISQKDINDPEIEHHFEKLNLKNPEYQTYGSSVGFVLETIFDRDLTISDYSNEELNDLKASIKTLEDVKRVKKELLKFGESIEKFDAYNYLMIKEKELKSEKDAD
ncbi:restriction system-associated AAA family ATPase [Empedobacter tilapiae]|uniref:Restriction system-associated AAA family ATPase n=1 Tax=Empedobacter tilapiae TaxID=2491114 RepID=A0A4Z1BCV6_9FLAO|nr:restriction system-associated AAA family ATPase [Empedobacter tilapiae]TGN26454.1 restriction system-associated AAA family ATPase [Empedobacter tilapiae]